MGQLLTTEPPEPNFIPNPKDPPIVGNKVAIKPNPKGYTFYKVFEGKPDEDVLQKAWDMTKCTIPLAILSVGYNSLATVEMRSGALQLFRTAVIFGVPVVGGGLVFVAAQALAYSARKPKNDNVNSFIASYATSAYLASRTKTYSKNHVFAVGGMAIGIVASVYREFARRGHQPLPNLTEDDPLASRLYHWQSHRCDWRLYENRPGYWIPAPAEGSSEAGSP